jgi:hypothetical protein
MGSTKSPNLELFSEREIKGVGPTMFHKKEWPT